MRATLLGVVSRGDGCAKFNSPAVYGSVAKAYSWIQETVTKEMEDDTKCPKPKENNGYDYMDLSGPVRQTESKQFIMTTVD